MLARRIVPAAHQQLLHPVRRRRQKPLSTLQNPPLILGMQRVHILQRRNPPQQPVRVDPLRQRQLQNDPMHIRISVQRINLRPNPRLHRRRSTLTESFPRSRPTLTRSLSRSRPTRTWSLSRRRSTPTCSIPYNRSTLT